LAGQPGGNPFPGASFFPIGGTYYIIPTEMKPTYEMQWNVNIQQKLGPDWLAQIGYLGTRSVHIWSAYDIDPSVYIQGSTAPANKRRLLYCKIQPWGNITALSIQAILVATEIRRTSGKPTAWVRQALSGNE